VDRQLTSGADKPLLTDRPRGLVSRQHAAQGVLAAGSSHAQGKAHFRPEPMHTPGHPIPLTPATALKLHFDALSEYERGEVLEFSEIYCTGHTADKVRATLTSSEGNHGYDDERGDYTIVPHDHIMFRYEVICVLGKGSFGQVVKAFDYREQRMVAVKIIRNKKRFHTQALVEVKILSHIKEHDQDDSANFVQMKDNFYFRSHLCIVFELLSINLYEFIKNNNFQGVSLPLIRRFAIQLLNSLRFLRKQRIVHCDLKPENILLKDPGKSAIKMIDFGSSCFEDSKVYTYIQSRFYRCPEVILGLPYHCAIDMWSLGCILAELFTGYPLFPGENEVEQLACIMEVLGVPPRKLVAECSRRKVFFDSTGNPRIVPNSRGKRRRPSSTDIMSAIRCTDVQFVSFLEGCLRWDIAERFTPEDGLQHEWILEATTPTPPVRGESSARGGRRQICGGLSHRERAMGAEQSQEYTSMCGIGLGAAPAGPRQHPVCHYSQGHPSLLPRIV